mgnify:CR=1 FL=1
MRSLTPELPQETVVEFPDNRLLIDLCGPHERNIVALEHGFDVQILRRGNSFSVQGEAEARQQAADALEGLYDRLERGRAIEPGDVAAAIRMGEAPEAEAPRAEQLDMFPEGRVEIRTRKKTIEPRSATQRRYAHALMTDELVFGIGPAGTGKTYLAVAAAVSMFSDGLVERIVLSRPAVEAGERLGFLPGDMKEKIDPYLRPLYDALHDMMPGKQLAKLMEEGRVEVAPLAFMRGRTLANAFVVLDEAQNATEMQMKMFLTRMGEGSRMAVTGDPSQIDLPRGVGSGLVQALRILEPVPEISVVRFASADVVRHPMVARIIDAYEQAGKTGG